MAKPCCPQRRILNRDCPTCERLKLDDRKCLKCRKPARPNCRRMFVCDGCDRTNQTYSDPSGADLAWAAG